MSRERYFTTQCRVSRSIYAFVDQKFQRDTATVLGLLWTATPPYTVQIPQEVWTLIAVATIVSIDDARILQHNKQKHSLRQYKVAAFTTLYHVLCRSVILLQPGDDSHAQLRFLHWQNNTWTLEDQAYYTQPA